MTTPQFFACLPPCTFFSSIVIPLCVQSSHDRRECHSMVSFTTINYWAQVYDEHNGPTNLIIKREGSSVEPSNSSRNVVKCTCTMAKPLLRFISSRSQDASHINHFYYLAISAFGNGPVGHKSFRGTVIIGWKTFCLYVTIFLGRQNGTRKRSLPFPALFCTK